MIFTQYNHTNYIYSRTLHTYVSYFLKNIFSQIFMNYLYNVKRIQIAEYIYKKYEYYILYIHTILHTQYSYSCL